MPDIKTEVEQAALSCHIVQMCAEGEAIVYNHAVNAYGVPKQQTKQAFFKHLYIDPIYHHLIDCLDTQSFILATLLKYKQKCEWFQNELLFKLWNENKEEVQIEPKYFAPHLFEYLYDNGVNFVIEPRSTSGRVDLLADQIGDERLVADAKIFTNDMGKSNVAKWFSQIYQYTLDHNERMGYLVIFKVGDNYLNFSLQEETPSIPFVTHNGKIIYFLVIDISLHKPASKLGKIKTYEITESDLTKKMPKV